MSEHITGFQTEDGAKKYDYNALANRPSDSTNTVISPNADYAEVGEWEDGNPSDTDRIGYFVAVAKVDDNTIKIRKAASADDVRGVTVYNPAFSGNASADKYGEDGELLPKYNYVGVMGIVSIIDNGKCTVNGRCMPADDGTAIPSENNMGYAVLERVDDTHVLIAVEPGADMVQRVKADIEDINDRFDNEFPEAINEALAQAKESGEFDGKDGTNGKNGTDGKSAYQYAQDGGYTGTEAEFAAKLAAEYLTSENDPTVPSWAKQTNKPSYTKNEVGLDHVDNVKQYSASNPPPYPVTSVNGYTGAVSLGMSDLALGHETWTFTLEDGSTVDKLVTLYVSNAAPT